MPPRAYTDVPAALSHVNEGHVPAYGEDLITARAAETLRELFGPRCEVLFALTGTGANVFALQSLIQSWQAVICADSSHLHLDECGAAEKFTGSKMLTAASVHGKLTPATLEPLLADSGMVHRVQPRVVSVSQCTERVMVTTAWLCERKHEPLYWRGTRNSPHARPE